MATIQSSINRTMQMTENARRIAKLQDEIINSMGYKITIDRLNEMSKVLVNSNLSTFLNDFQKQLTHVKYSMEPIQETLKLVSEHIKPIDLSGLYEVRNLNLKYENYIKGIDFSNFAEIYSKLSSFDISNLGLIEVELEDYDEKDFEDLEEDEQNEVNIIIGDSLSLISRGEIYLDNLWTNWYAKLQEKHPISAKLIAKVSSVIFDNLINYFLVIIIIWGSSVGNLPIKEEPSNNAQIVYNINISNVSILQEENIKYYYKVVYVDDENNEQIGYVSKRKYTEVVQNLNELAEE